MKSFSRNALLFITLTTGMFLLSAQIFPSAVVEGKRQTQATTTVCDANAESCSTTICTDGQPCVTTQIPTKTETNPKQYDLNNNAPLEKQAPIEEQAPVEEQAPIEEQAPVEEQASTAPEEDDPFFADYVDRYFD
jgi:hypothetical protein